MTTGLTSSPRGFWRGDVSEGSCCEGCEGLDSEHSAWYSALRLRTTRLALSYLFTVLARIAFVSPACVMT